MILIPINPTRLRGRYRRYCECALEEARRRKRCEIFERLCGGPAVWAEAHPFDVEKLRRRELSRQQTARAMQDLLRTLRAPRSMHLELVHFIHIVAIAGRPLDLSDFVGEKGERFVLLSSAAGPSHWQDLTSN
jgi:hypothetical protein